MKHLLLLKTHTNPIKETGFEGNFLLAKSGLK